MYCKQCNFEIGNQRFCPNCGADNLAQSAPAPQYNVAQEPFAAPTTPVMDNSFNAPTMSMDNQYSAPMPMDNPYSAPSTPNNPYAAPVDNQFNAPQQQYSNPQPAYTPTDNYAAPQNNYGNYGSAPAQDYSQYMPQQQYPQNNVPVMQNDPGDQKATLALLFGCLGFVLGPIFSILALVFSNQYTKIGNGSKAGHAKIGKILGIIQLALVAVSVVLSIILFIIGIFAGMSGY